MGRSDGISQARDVQFPGHRRATAGLGGDSFSARLTALRRHGPIGAAEPLEVPALRDYGVTAPEAEARVIQAMRDWLTASPDTAEQPAQGCAAARQRPA